MKKKQKLIDLYNELKKKYNLPNFEDLDKIFEIHYISEELRYPLREIRRIIYKKLKYVCRLIEKTLYTPDSNIIDLYDSSSFSKKELEDLFKILRKIALLIREEEYLEIKGSEEKEDAEWINKAYKVWKEIEKDIKEFISKKVEYWKKEKKFKSIKEYVG